MFQQFKSGDASPLVAGAGFVHPNMDGDTFVMGSLDRSSRCAMIYAGDPSGITVGKDVDDWLLIVDCFLLVKLLNESQSMFAYVSAMDDAFLGDFVGSLKGYFNGLLFIRDLLQFF